MDKFPAVVLAAGGTGGHIFPAEALALELKKRGFKLALISDFRGNQYSGVLGNIETYSIQASGIAGKNLGQKFNGFVNLIIGMFQARSILKRVKPHVVIGFGGYASFPTMVAACFGAFRTIIHEQNAILGRANRLLAAHVDYIATSFQSTDAIPSRLNRNDICTGMPVRKFNKKENQIKYPTFNEKEKLKILVLGGSQGAKIFSRVIPEAIKNLGDIGRSRIEVVQQCRSEDIETVESFYKKIGVKAELRVFFDDVLEKIAKSHLIISRSGASTIAELTTIGRPSILIPYPYAVDEHQTKNAIALDSCGAGWLIPEQSFTSEMLSERLDFLLNLPVNLAKAAGCAKAMGKPDATKALADLVCSALNCDHELFLGSN